MITNYIKILFVFFVPQVKYVCHNTREAQI